MLANAKARAACIGLCAILVGCDADESGSRVTGALTATTTLSTSESSWPARLNHRWTTVAPCW